MQKRNMRIFNWLVFLLCLTCSCRNVRETSSTHHYGQSLQLDSLHHLQAVRTDFAKKMLQTSNLFGTADFQHIEFCSGYDSSGRLTPASITTMSTRLKASDTDLRIDSSRQKIQTENSVDSKSANVLSNSQEVQDIKTTKNLNIIWGLVLSLILIVVGKFWQNKSK